MGKNNGKTNDDKKLVNKQLEKGDRTCDKRVNSKPNKDERKDKKYSYKGSNDPRWYTKSDKLLNDSASLPYSWATGIDINVKNDVYNLDLYNKTIPGIITMNVNCIPGISTTGGDPVNIAAKNIYSFVRHANSGHANYDSSDLMLYFLAVDSLYTFISNSKRLYGILSLASQENRYYPTVLTEALGFKYSDFIQNVAQFRYWLNSFILRAGALCVPGNFSIYARHQFMFERIYADAPLAKAQIYAFRPYGFYKYNEKSSPNGGKLAFTKFDGLAWDFKSYVELGESLLAPLVESEDIGIMSGDILKAYTESGLYKTTLMDDLYFVLPVFDAEVLDQIKNAIIIPQEWGVDTLDIEQNVNKNILVYNPTFTITDEIYPEPSQDILCSNPMLSFNKETVTAVDTMVGSRLTCTLKGVQGDNSKRVFSSVGSEYIHGAAIWYRNNDSAAQYDFTNIVISSLIHVYAGATPDWNKIQAIFDKLIGASCFDYCPRLNLLTATVSGSNTTFKQYLPLWDIGNWTVVATQTLWNMHQTALLSMYDVPLMGLNK